MLMLFHPPTLKMNDTANPIPPSVSLFAHRWMHLKQLKNWAAPSILLPALSAFIGKSKNNQFDIYSRSAFGWKKSHSHSLSFSFTVSLNPLTVTPLDFGNLRPGVKMAPSGESAHPSWLPQLCWLLDLAKQARCLRCENRTASRRWGQGTSPVPLRNKGIWQV